MKRILFLLLLTVSVYGQNPSRFAKIQITGNSNSGTATKVNVQEADGVVNTIAKNDLIDVVEVNDVSSLPLIGEAGKIYVVKNLNKIYRWNGTFYQELTTDISGKEDIANKQNSLAVDGTNTKYPTVTAVNTGLALKANLASPALTGTPTVPTATAGTNTTQIATTAFVTGANAGNVKLTGSQSVTGIKSFSNPNSAPIQVTTNNGNGILVNATTGIGLQATSSGNFTAANFTGQAGANTLTITNQSGSTGAGLSVFNTGAGFNIASSGGSVNNFTVDKFGATTATSFIKSSAPTTNLLLAGGGDIAQSTFQPAITGLTTNYLPKWNGSSFGNSSIFDNGGTDISIINGLYSEFSIKGNQSLDNGGGQLNFSNQTKRFATISGETESPNNGLFIVRNLRAGVLRESLRIISNGRILINKTDDDLTNQLQVAGTISASPATTANQVPTWGQVQEIAKPYKVYTALLNQSGTNAPVATVLENTLGGTIVWSRTSVGRYTGTLNNAFTLNKTIVFLNLGGANSPTAYSTHAYSNSISTVLLQPNPASDNLLSPAAIEIRVYN